MRCLLLLSTALLLAPAAPAQPAGAFTCPATFTVTEPAKSEHAFQTVKIYNGNPGKEEYDLRPDDESKKGKSVRLTWVLKDYRSMNLFARCFYYDTKETVTKDIPAAVQKCTLTLQLDAKGTIFGKSQMQCE
jgi:hypothetical protein